MPNELQQGWLAEAMASPIADGQRTRGAHQEELKLDQWIEEQKAYETNHPITLQNPNFFVPVNEISISAAPSSEQDVIALFNQLLAGGVIRGIRVMASSSHQQYDGLFRYHLRAPLANHIYDALNNPLGIQDTPNPEGFFPNHM